VVPAAVYSRAADLHANFVRITVPWSDVEPTRPTGPVDHLTHHWNTRLLSMLDAEISGLARRHIQVLIDFHQYHWSPYYAHVACKGGAAVCRATGVPAWYYEGRYPQTKHGEARAQADFWDGQSQSSLFYYGAFAEMIARRYGHHANVVGYEIFNEPHLGTLSDDAGTSAVLAWEAQIYRLLHAVDPNRTIFVMCRGGGEGVGTADLSVFGKGAKIALDFHDYFNGEAGKGLDAAGDDWTPSWDATHTQDLSDAQGYTGSAVAQNRVLQVPLAAAGKAGIPLLIGEWGIHENDRNAPAYTAQMLQVFRRNGLSWARWRLNPGFGFDVLKAVAPFTPRPQAEQLSAALKRSGSS
jgi:aryl-phospho-beta-D-glucosidase BglC (GH1 family)